MIHVNRVHITSDAPMSEAQARAVGTQLVTEVNASLKTARAQASRVRIGELRVNLSGGGACDHAAITRYARSVAQRILDRTPE
jgi:hypothetical protein